MTKFGKSLRYTSFAFSSATAANTGISMISDFDNAMDIFRGNYYYDESKSVAGQLLQGFSRSTRERFQQFIGYNFSQGRNIGGDVNQVTYYRGAVLANLRYGEPGIAKKSGMTMGNMINGWNINSTDDSMFMHESATSCKVSDMDSITGCGRHRQALSISLYILTAIRRCPLKSKRMFFQENISASNFQ